MFMTGDTAAPRAVPATRMPASLGLLPLADVADGERRDGWPERVIRRKDAVISVPVLARRRHKVGEPVDRQATGFRASGPPPRCTLTWCETSSGEIDRLYTRLCASWPRRVFCSPTTLNHHVSFERSEQCYNPMMRTERDSNSLNNSMQATYEFWKTENCCEESSARGWSDL